MTRTREGKPADRHFAAGRFRKAVAFHGLARLAADSPVVRDSDVVTANAVLAAIAYADALTAAYGGRVNQKDHAAIKKLLRDVLGTNLPDAQERRLARLLSRKDQTAYGAGFGPPDQAREVVDNLDQFGSWATELLAAKQIIAAIRADDQA